MMVRPIISAAGVVGPVVSPILHVELPGHHDVAARRVAVLVAVPVPMTVSMAVLVSMFVLVVPAAGEGLAGRGGEQGRQDDQQWKHPSDPGYRNLVPVQLHRSPPAPDRPSEKRARIRHPYRYV